RLVAADRLVRGTAAEQLLEQRPVVPHRLTEILRRGLAALVRLRDAVRGAVPLDELRMLDGDVRRPLLEVVRRVAAFLHDLLDERVRLDHRTGRVVHELDLRRLPALHVALPRLGCQLADVQRLVTLLPMAQLTLGFTPIARLLDGAVVLASETFSE